MKKEEKYIKSLFQKFKSIDLFFLQLTFALIVSGLIFAFSSSTYISDSYTNNFLSFGIKQFIAFIVGFILLLYFMSLNYKFWYKSAWSISLFILLLMLLIRFTPLGRTSGGSHRWIDLGIIQFQPAEIAKFCVLVLISKFLTKYKWNNFKSWHYLLFTGILTIIVLRQPDLGSAAIVGIVTLELIFLFGWPIWLISSFVSLALFVIIQTITHTPYQMERITYWFKPYLDPSNKGYNLIQAMYALALGGIPGAGLGNSLQKRRNLPIPHADFIVAVMAEEIGFLGMTAILILYLTWILRGLYLTKNIENKFGKILATGIILLTGTQATLNIAVAVGLLPVTGVTLPFFSCGGTSLILTLAMCGVLFNIFSEKESKII